MTDDIQAKHEARVTELLEANNREVERRRSAERLLAQALGTIERQRDRIDQLDVTIEDLETDLIALQG